MPRPRKPDATIPAHIDQTKIPAGCYWDKRDRYWYAIIRRPKPHRQRIAAGDALLSDLHREMEMVRGIDSRTLDWLLGEFEASLEYRQLAADTQEDYAYCRLALQRHKTKLGVPFAELERARITTPLIQRLVNAMAETHPSKANHVKRYLSTAFQWGKRNVAGVTNPAAGVKQAKERKAHRMPPDEVMRAVVTLLRERGALASRRKGSVAPYVWAVAMIAYKCRMRSVEVRDLTDANATDAGVIVRRHKGSLDTVVAWDDDLRDAWGWLVARRARVWLKKPAMRARLARPMVVSEDGAALSKSALNSAWRRAMAVAIEAGKIDASQRFGLHGLKHRGVTDTHGTKADKKDASGHKTDAMANLYDHEAATVSTPGKPFDLRSDLRKAKK